MSNAGKVSEAAEASKTAGISEATDKLIQINDLTKYFVTSRLGRRKSEVRAVDGVNLSIAYGQTLGLVGESGCGKSTLSRLILRLIPATAGQVLLKGTDILGLSARELREVRQRIQMVFQNPYTSLSPRMRIYDAVKAPLDVLSRGNEQAKSARVREVFEMVGLQEAYLYRYPHEFSGGQRQRIAIARALVTNPEFIICDEPVSALDVSVRAQVLNLLSEIQAQQGISFLFISHDLSVVHHIAHNVAVMYLGAIVEVATKRDLYDHPLHPYTNALLSSVLQPLGERRYGEVILQGEVPSPTDVPQGCRFSPRCPWVQERCTQTEPALRDVGLGHLVACHGVGEDAGYYERVPQDSDVRI
jgi:peptide/nickel transport system ATP-binding protein/oligopeptide transport system ATP-binding protein